MTKKLNAIILAIIMTMSLTGLASAASVKCTVVSIEDGKVLLDCGKKSKKLEVGGKVKVKTMIAMQAIEGC